MKIGDYLIAKISAEKDITCGDGIVGKFIIKKGDKFKITSIVKEQFEIKYNDTHLWFTTSEDIDFFVEDYKIYFYDCDKTNRKLKLNKLNNVKNFHNK